MALSVVQVKPAAGTGISLTATFSSGIAANSIILVVANYAAAGFPTVSCTSSGSVTDSSLGDAYDGNSIVGVMKAFFAPSAGTTSVTLTVSASAAITMVIYEIAGFSAGTAAFDSVPAALTGQSTGPTSNTTATLAQADEVAVGLATDYSTFTGVGSGWTTQGASSSPFGNIEGYQILSSTSPIAFTATETSVVFAMALVATVKGTISGGGASLPFNQYDWNIPKSVRLSLPDASAALNTNLFTNPFPLNQYNWPRTVRSPRAPFDLSVPTNPNLFKNPIPFNQFDWSKPVRTRQSPFDLSTPTNPNLLTNPVPILNVDYSRPFPIRSMPDTSIPLNLNLFAIGPVALPFNQYDWTPARRVRPSIAFDAGFNPNLQTNPFPFNAYIWPPVTPPRFVPDPGQAYNPNLYTVTVVLLPFNQYDWPTTQRPVPRAQESVPLNIALLSGVVAGPMPFNQYNWVPVSPLPRSPAPDVQNYALLASVTPPPVVSEQYEVMFFANVGKLMGH